MKTQLKNIFAERAAQSSLALALALPAAASAQDVSSLLTRETYWKANVVDAVIALRPCPETKMCAHLVWFNPKDQNLHTYFGIPGKTARTPEQLRTTFCNFSPRMRFVQTSPTTGEGTLAARGMGMNLNIRATMVSDQRIDVRINKAFITKRDTWTRVTVNDARYPHCVPL